MTRYFYTARSYAGTNRFPSGNLKHKKYVMAVADEKQAEEVAKHPEFVEITEAAYKELFFGGGVFHAPRHALKKAEEKAETTKPEPAAPKPTVKDKKRK